MRLPRPTARLRLTGLYGVLFLLSGTALLAVTYLLVGRAAVQPGQVPVDIRPAPLSQPHQVIAEVHQQSARDLKQLLIQSPLALAIVAVLAVALGWFTAGRILRPISTITATARRISASNLHERLNLHGPDDELKDLGDTLDKLFARLEASFEAQRHFIANASHELRTPVTADRTLLQVALDDPATTTEMWRAAGQELLASNSEQERLIEALLTLATSEGGLDQHEHIDLSAITGTVLLAPHPETGYLGLHVQGATQPATLDGDPLLVQRLVANLIDNAVRHNVTGGKVEIATGTRHGCAVLSVTNTGPVIPPTEIDRLFQPFQRLNARRAYHHNGHGLGLSIVRAIATAHGATITAQAPPDGGLTIDVTFPAASPSGPPCQARSNPDHELAADTSRRALETPHHSITRL
jgi:signal transduction histidine kinase